MARALEKTRGERAARLYRSLPGAAWGRPVFHVSSAARDDTSRPVHAQAATHDPRIGSVGLAHARGTGPVRGTPRHGENKDTNQSSRSTS